MEDNKFRLHLPSLLFLYKLNFVTQCLWKQTKIEMYEDTLMSLIWRDLFLFMLFS